MSGVAGAIGGALGGLTSDVRNTNSNQTQQSSGTTNVAGTTLGTTAGGYNAFHPYGETALQNLPNYWGQANSLVSSAAPALNYNTDVSPLLSPFAGNQIAANFASTALPEAQQRSYLQGSLSKNPYASSNGGAEAMFENQLAAQHGKTAADIYGTSYGQALTTAEQEKQRQAGLASTSGQLQTGQLGALQNLIGLGGTYGNTAGQQQQAGTSTGLTNTTGNSTTTDQPSLASTILGGLGAFGKLFGGKADGGVIRGYDAGGAVSTPGTPLGGTAGPGAETPMPPWMGNTAISRPMAMAPAPQSMGQPMAQPPPAGNPMGGTLQAPMMPFSGQLAPQGAMPGMPPNPAMPKAFASGGTVAGSEMPSGDDFSGKVMSAFKTFHAMRKHAQDGGVMEDGGWGAGTSTAPEAPAGDSGDWIKDQALYNQGVIDTAPKQPSMMSRVAGALGDWGKSMQRPASPASAQPAPQSPAGNPALSALGQAMNGLRPAAAEGGVMRRGYALGGGGGGIGADDVTPGSLGVGTGDAAPYGSVDYGGGSAIQPFMDANPRNAALPPIPSKDVSPRVAAGEPYKPMPSAPPMAPPPELARAPRYGSAADVLSSVGYKPPSKMDTFFEGLMQTPRASGAGGLFSGIGKAYADKRLADMQAARLVAQTAESTGQLPGVNGGPGIPTLAAKAQAMAEQKLPHEIENLKAHTEPAQIYMQAVEAENKSYQSRLDQINLMQTLILPSAPDYKAQMENLNRARDRAQLTHDETLARLQRQRASGVPPPVIKPWVDEGAPQ